MTFSCYDSLDDDLHIVVAGHIKSQMAYVCVGEAFDGLQLSGGRIYYAALGREGLASTTMSAIAGRNETRGRTKRNRCRPWRIL